MHNFAQHLRTWISKEENTGQHRQLFYMGARKIERSKNKIKSVQSVMALRSCSAYCTTSTHVLLVVAGLTSLHILVADSRVLFHSKGKQDMVVSPGTAPRDLQSYLHAGDYIREETINQWQNYWNTTPKGKWTRRLIKEIKPWINREWGPVRYYVYQCLEGL